MVTFAESLPSSACAQCLFDGHGLQFNVRFLQQYIEVMPCSNTIPTLKDDARL